ncbi:MAG: hypothetical protein H6626_10660 [Pseudobdellovibrionaceae bacterium]|nr:hypothetical protein [Bdellovibrionales bacterium]USN46667.1 MAG: hypothetical protein H6626_10660 [Pseudobdellovibrionaceae bacterium]
MNYDEVFTQLKKFLESKPASTHAISKLSAGEEIQLIVDDHLNLALFNKAGQPLLEQRLANKPNVEFKLSTEAVRTLLAQPGDNMADFGIAVVKQIVEGEVKIRICGSVLAVLRKGYLKIILEAGPDFTKYLASRGLKGAGKITSLIKGLKG